MLLPNAVEAVASGLLSLAGVMAVLRWLGIGGLRASP
jgi:hypothetical protein